MRCRLTLTSSVLTRLILGGLTVVACVDAERVAPRPPNVAALRAAYAPPDGLLTQQNAPAVTGALVETFGQLGATKTLLGAVAGVLDSLNGGGRSTTEEALSESRQALSAKGTGWMVIEYICPGQDFDAPVDAAVNGQANLTVLFANSGIKDVIWGALSRCVVTDGSETRWQLDGALEVIVALESDPGFVAHFAGGLQQGDEPSAAFDLDFQIGEAGGLRLSLPTPDGQHVLFGLRADESGEVSYEIIDKLGSWGCILGGEGLSGQCRRGDEEIEWTLED